MIHRTVAATVAAALVAGLCGCDGPGPLSSAALGGQAMPPGPPLWGRPLNDRPLTSAFPSAAKCIGFVDRYSERYAGGRKVVGWSWNVTRSQPVQHLVVVDAAGRIVGFGDGGEDRPDVAAAHPEVTTQATGWSLVTPTRERRYALYGVDEAARSACYVGELRP